MPKTAYLVGGSIVDYPFVLTKDSACLFVISSSYVKGFNTTTGALFRVLSCGDALCGIFLNPLNDQQLFAVSKNGAIQLWDYINTKVISRYSIGKSEIQRLLMHPKETKLYFTSGLHFFEAPITDEGLLEPKSLFQVGNALDIKSTNDGSHIAILSSNNLKESTVYVYDTTKKRLLRFFNKGTSKQHYTLAIHPNGDSLLLGDNCGKIFVFNLQDKHPIQSYRNSLDIDQKKEIPPVLITPMTSVHWHSTKVVALSFSLDGGHFLSSANEGVLVEWKVNNYSKRFYPRFGDSISCIQQTPDGFRYCISLSARNSIVLFSPNSRGDGLSIEGIKIGVYSYKKNYLHRRAYEGRIESKLTFDPLSKALAFSGVAGALQIYDPIRETQLLQVPIGTFSNVVAGAFGPLGLCHVQEVCFSADGTLAATIDWRPLNEDLEITLKFWERNQDQYQFKINTSVISPHSQKVNGLIFHPKQALVISLSDDGKFKIWSRWEDEDIWICKSILSYEDRIPKNATFSKDGSIFVISFDENITLWDSQKLVLKQAFSFSKEEILGLSFVADSLLATYTKNGIYVWNLLSCTIAWSYCARVTALGVDLNNQTLAIAVETTTEKYNVLLFSVESAIPLNVWKVPSQVNEIVFFPEKNERGTSAIVCRTHAKHLLILSEETRFVQRSENEKPFVPKVIPTQGTVLPSSSTKTTPVFSIETLKSTHSMFDTPSHVIPSLDSIFNPLMDSLLTRKANTSKQQGESSTKRKDEPEPNDGSDKKKSKQ